jgi:hypothetical protein
MNLFQWNAQEPPPSYRNQRPAKLLDPVKKQVVFSLMQVENADIRELNLSAVIASATGAWRSILEPVDCRAPAPPSLAMTVELKALCSERFFLKKLTLSA